uniref:Uncharacterized protein n=1 Tax=Physcomitrium patens TaxID=3218 RepID=A0A2K1ICG7_PHYPA|nr:hypothetical protein PHYPA_030456 [Physcomitrium patens]
MCLKSAYSGVHTTMKRRSSHWQGSDVEPPTPGSCPKPLRNLQKAQWGNFSSILALQSWTVASLFPGCLKAQELLYRPKLDFHLLLKLLSGQTAGQLIVFAPLVYF